MNLIEIAEGRYINVDKYFSFTLGDDLENSDAEYAVATAAETFDEVFTDEDTVNALREYQPTGARRNKWIRISIAGLEQIINAEEIGEVEVNDEYCVIRSAGTRKADRIIQIKPTSYLKIKDALCPENLVASRVD